MTPPNPPRLPDNALGLRVRRIRNSLADLNARIARLSMFLQLSLDTEAKVQLVIERNHPLFRRHEGRQPGADAGSRQRQALEELRGLLVLRCKVMAKLLETLGLELTGQIANQAEDHLERLGFEPGADGFHLLPRTLP